MEFIGYLGAILVGIVLGLLGAGGSIITIPVLIYLFRIDALHATTYSFFIVGCTALFGAVTNIRKRTVNVLPALFFAIPGVISIYIVRQYILNAIPEILFTMQGTVVTRDIFILLLFAVIMTIAAISMITAKDNKNYKEQDITNKFFGTLSVLGFIVGICIGFVGVGGGFLITPALIVFGHLPIRKAIGTSLCIISLNSFVGFFSSLQLHESIDWRFLFLFVFLTVLGVVAGTYISKGIQSAKLKKIFGWFVLAMSIYILAKELILEISMR